MKESLSTASPFDVIFMDEVMPNMNGSVAIAQIRHMGFRGLIVSVTGNALEDDKISILASGANKIMTKPLKLPELRTLLQGNPRLFCNE